MADNTLTAQVRETSGKGVARKLRAAGRIPGVCYGSSQEPQPLSLDPKKLERLLAASDAGMNTLIDLTVEGSGVSGSTVVLVKDIQRDPIRGHALHADLLAIDVSQTIDVTIPIHIHGTAIGVSRDAGILDQALRELELECMPTSIPDEIFADVSAMEIGESLHIRDLVLPEGVKLLSDPDLSVVSVVAPTVVEEEAEVTEEGAEAVAAAGAEDAADETSDDGKKDDGGDS